MKTITSIIILSLFGAISTLQAQTDPKPKTEVTNNFLDLQAGTLGNIFGDSLTGDNGEVTNYLDLVNKSDMPEVDKQNLRDAYARYSKTLDAKGKDSLQGAMTQQLLRKTEKDTIK
jgi:hypothetical protein